MLAVKRMGRMLDPTLDPPDGGWGWMVVLGSFVINLAIFGFYRAGGIVLLACVAHFGLSRSVVAWIPIMTVGLSFFMAPVSGALVKAYSYRQIVFIGGMVSAAGLAICTFALRIEHVFLGYGVILGIGFGLTLGPNLAVVGVYFRRRRALATGMSFSGGAVGTFLVGPLVEFLIDEYTLKGAFLILSAFLLHICVAATLFRPLEEFYVINGGYGKKSSSAVSSGKETPTTPKWAGKKALLLNGSLPGHNQLNSIPVQYTMDTGKLDNTNGEVITFADDVDHLPPGSRLSQIIEINGNNFDFNLKKLSFDALLNGEGREEDSDEESKTPQAATRALLASSEDSGKRRIPRIIVTSDDGEAYCPSFSSSTEFLDEAKPAVPPAATTVSATLPALLYSQESPGCCDSTCNLSLLTNVLLLLVSLGYGLTLAVYIAVMVILPDHVLQVLSDADKMDGVVCVSAASAGDLVSRFCIGWVVDKLANRKRFLYQATFFLFGLVVTLLPLACCYWLLLLMCLAMGALFGTCLVHSPCFVAEYVGVAKLPMAMGFMLFLTGIPTLALGPVIGVMRDATGDYNLSLWTMGILLMVGSTTWFVQPQLYSYQKKKDRKREEVAYQPTGV